MAMTSHSPSARNTAASEDDWDVGSVVDEGTDGVCGVHL